MRREISPYRRADVRSDKSANAASGQTRNDWIARLAVQSFVCEPIGSREVRWADLWAPTFHLSGVSSTGRDRRVSPRLGLGERPVDDHHQYSVLKSWMKRSPISEPMARRPLSMWA